MFALANKRILLGITGGIAAYKSADLVRRLRAAGASVRVVMTRAACEFITPLTLQALSGQPVRTDLLDPSAEAAMGHIELARWADAVLVAPASADFMAKLVHGRADDLLSTLCLASSAPLALAPAMNHVMWTNAATQGNVGVLRARGVHLFGPGQGDLACGESGPGRMLEPEQLLAQVAGLFETGLLVGTRVLVTAGPTREDIDAVRFISNRSSGKMGYAVAGAAAEAGAQVTLVSGPVALAPPARVECIAVLSAQDMYDAVLARAAGCDIFVAAAAVADYRPATAQAGKLKKSAPELTLNLQRTPDILASVAALPGAPFTVGFAAETEALAEHARAKLADKSVDMIAANWVGRADSGFDSDTNALQLFWRDGGVELPLTGKERLARELIGVIAQRYRATRTPQ
jgi:phosphopantothenoylcysteine decarboxylase/phosphopantothenate--cysteine ligase